jgi:hypothetical protein
LEEELEVGSEELEELGSEELEELGSEELDLLLLNMSTPVTIEEIKRQKHTTMAKIII